MRYFSLLDFQHLVLAVLLGAVALVFAVVAWAGYARREGETPPAAGAPETPEAEDHPIAPFLVFVYVGALASALGYAIVAGVFGGPVGY